VKSTQNTGFYSEFFRDKTFLAAGSDLADIEHFASWGFAPGLDFGGGIVLELGAGRGRLTTHLDRIGALATAGRYLVVEPSEGLEHIERAVRQPNMAFHRAELGQLETFVQPGSVDYFIASGVIPHIESAALAATIARMAKFIRPGGVLHIVASYYGFPKSAAFALNDCCVGHPARARISASFTAALQQLCCSGVSERMRAFYIRNFIYSFQTTFRGQSDQMREFYSVSPYNIRYGYQDYFDAIGHAGLVVERLLPYSLALVARKGGVAARFERPPPNARVAVLGEDWSARYVKDALERKYSYRVRCYGSVGDLGDCDAVVVAYDYTRAAPYHTAVQELEARGYELGTTLFLFQMLC
jgi:SAM-dependent methyltransferase